MKTLPHTFEQSRSINASFWWPCQSHMTVAVHGPFKELRVQGRCCSQKGGGPLKIAETVGLLLHPGRVAALSSLKSLIILLSKITA